MPSLKTRAAALTLSVLAAGSALSAVAAPAHAAAPGRPVLTLTFDDALSSQFANALPVLNKHGVKATFYVITGRVGGGGNLSWQQVKDLQNQGHEIGGHTISHPHLAGLGADDLRRELCDSRTTLLQQGLKVSSLAYPFGEYDGAVQDAARACGYDNARRTGPIRPDGTPVAAETLPPADRFAVRAPASFKSGTTADDLKRYVNNAVQAGGAWLPLTFHDVCPAGTCADDYGVSAQVIDQFLTWARTQPVDFGTVAQAIGGRVQPPPKPLESDLKVTLTGPVRAKPGTTVAYQVTTSDGGDRDATGVKTVVRVPGLTGVTAPGCAVAGTTVSCDQGGIAQGQSRKVTVTGKLTGTPGQSPKATAAATSTSPEKNPADNGAELGTLILKPDAVLRADLKLTGSVSGRLKSGRTASLRLTLANKGNTSAKKVVLTGTLPRGVKILSVKGCKRQGRTGIRCTFADFRAARKAVITVRFRVPRLKRSVRKTLSASVRTSSVETSRKNNSVKIVRRFTR
ncbi:polysaccharide deacetylase family protein [Actinocorallia longicatena]|uniref:NodB homology domain-containing protein n=1 Tax=Actinocorallia longicatena TaxID=111803 RepID=A0ABP6QF02_9ACTN